ncbi:MAG TPA: hypothetical protein VGZ22_20920 [Isosphaeraceae bacterium]|jgi:hypothetical protein|nr:hypothetical protein [Isosphaeraceae bacterium]
MKAKTRALALATTAAVVGCTPSLTGLRKELLLPPLAMGGSGKGQLIAPKQCDVWLAVVSHPLGDNAVNEAVWRVADEQVIGPEARRVLDANGIRIGLFTGGLPQELEDLLHAPAPHKVDATEVIIPSSENSLFAMGAGTPKTTLILGRDGHTIGKDYTDVCGYFRVTATHDGPGVNLRFVPELHHGPVQHRYTADASTNPFSVQQFVLKDGQQEDTLRELAAGLTLQPDQTAVIGCWPDRPGSLGHFLLTEPEANSDRLRQKVLIIRASQNRTAGFSPPSVIKAGGAGTNTVAGPGSGPVGGPPAQSTWLRRTTAATTDPTVSH